MLKLLHLADVHLGKPFQMLGAQGAAQRRALEETFGRAVESHAVPALDLTITGCSADPGTPASPLSGWPRQRSTRFAVGVTHGSVYRGGQVEGSAAMHPQEIRDLGLDYLALGDWHSA